MQCVLLVGPPESEPRFLDADAVERQTEHAAIRIGHQGAGNGRFAKDSLEDPHTAGEQLILERHRRGPKISPTRHPKSKSATPGARSHFEIINPVGGLPTSGSRLRRTSWDWRQVRCRRSEC